jgi:ubiquinone/menaquinone biosynthesis C-methylase UbiE
MKLNIGAGDTRHNGFLNCDYDEHSNPDYVFDLEKDPFPFEDNSIEEVIAHHVLEHMGEGYFHCLKELYRVCKHGAMIDIRVPHHRHDHFINDPTHRRAITPGGLWLFSKKYNDTAKEQGAAASRLAYYYNVNFEVLDVINIPSKEYIKVFEGKTVQEVEQYMHEHNNIIEEVNIKLIVIRDD